MDIKEIARGLVRKHGLINLTRSALSEAAGIPDGSFPYTAGCSFTELVNELQLDEELMASQPDGVSVSSKRVNPVLRKDHLLNVAVDLAKAQGYTNITRAAISEAAGVSEALVSHYFGGMSALREEIMVEAVRRPVIEIVAQGLGAGDAIAKNASGYVKQQAVLLMMGV
jgi:hypothetical protein